MDGNSILIKNGRIWNGRTFLDGDVLAENGVITKVGEVADQKADYEFDARGCIVSPGLVDIHTHMRGISSDMYGAPIEAVSFPFGVTAVAEASAIQGSREFLNAVMVKNVVFVCAEIKNNKVDFTDIDRLLHKYGEKAVGIKVFYDTALCDVTNTSPLREICRYAQNQKLKVMVHSTGAPVTMKELLNCLAEGDICTHVYHGGRNNVYKDGFVSLREAKQRGVIIDNGMAGGVHTDFRILKEAIDEGVFPDTISSDITCSSAFMRGGRYGLTMCMSILRKAGMQEDLILKAVTRNAARALGKEKYWGMLEEGRCADIAVLKYTDEGFDISDRAGNRIGSDKGYRCLLTVSDGQVVYRY